MDMRVRLAVGRRDHLVDVDPQPLGIAGELIGQGDVHVAVGGVGQLAEFGGLGARHRHDLRVEDGLVEGGRAGRGRRPDPADQLRVRRQVPEDMSR